MRAIVPSMFEKTTETTNIIPVDLQRHALNGTQPEFMHDPKWGYVLTQFLSRNLFGFWKYVIKTEEDRFVQFLNSRPVIALFVPQEEQFNIAKDVFALHTPVGYMQLGYLPESTEYKVFCHKGKTLIFFQIDFSWQELARTAAVFGKIDELEALLASAQNEMREPACLEDMPLAKKEKDLFDSISKELKTPGGADFFLDAHIGKLLWWYLSQLDKTGYEEIIRNAGFFMTRKHLKKARAVRTILETDFKGKYSLSKLASMSGMTSRKLQQVFRYDTGDTLSAFRSKARMAEAARQLKETANTIKAISLNVGFRHKGDFNKTFKKEYSVSPSEWRAAAGK